jgi:hypothetical protein
MNSQLTWYVVGAGLALVGVQLALAARLAGALRAVNRMGERITHLADALSLLTETSESGFGAVAGELERQRVTPRRSNTRSVATRVANAARRGRTTREIAVVEQMSEGEVHLRLHLAESAAREKREGHVDRTN